MVPDGTYRGPCLCHKGIRSFFLNPGRTEILVFMDNIKTFLSCLFLLFFYKKKRPTSIGPFLICLHSTQNYVVTFVPAQGYDLYD